MQVSKSQNDRWSTGETCAGWIWAWRVGVGKAGRDKLEHSVPWPWEPSFFSVMSSNLYRKIHNAVSEQSSLELLLLF